MIHEDTIKLLRECDSGVKMGTSSIEDVLDYVHSEKLKEILSKCKEEHYKLDSDIQQLLYEYGDDGRDPNPIVKSMSWMKTNMKLVMNGSDQTVADLMTDGCNMGIKSLNKYLNEYEAAEEKVKDITKKLIALEKKLSEDMRDFL